MFPFTSNDLDSLSSLFRCQIRCLYDMKHRQVDCLDDLHDQASSQRLKNLIEEHLSESRGQVQRLETVFSRLAVKPERETCTAMKALIQEARDVAKSSGETDVRDAALIAAIQNIAHYGIANFGHARTWAKHLGRDDLVDLLEKCLAEERSADRRLTELAESDVNQKATHQPVA